MQYEYIWKGRRLVLPRKLCGKYVRGTRKMELTPSEAVWWFTLESDIKEMVSGCVTYLVSGKKASAKYLHA